MTVGLALVGLPVFAADLETQVIGKNCFMEIFEDDNFDADVAIATGELSKLIPDLLEALGGEAALA